MSDIEVTLADLGELATREIAKNARVDLERKIGEKVITKSNALNYEYKEEKLLETNKR